METQANSPTLRIVMKYLQVLRDHQIHIEAAFLFGSQVKAESTQSDIDIAILSPDFSGDRFADRRLLVPLRRSIDRRIEPIPFLPEDFSENDPLAAEILHTGLKVA